MSSSIQRRYDKRTIALTALLLALAGLMLLGLDPWGDAFAATDRGVPLVEDARLRLVAPLLLLAGWTVFVVLHYRRGRDYC